MFSFNLSKISVMLGIILLNLPIGLAMYYGGMSVYLDSYFISTIGIDNYPQGSLWPLAIFGTLNSGSGVIAGILSSWIGPRKTTLVGVVFFIMSLALTFFSIQSSFWAMVATLSVLGGISSGISYSMTVLYATVWFPERLGLAISSAYFSVSSGAFLVNLAVTFYINPNNLPAELRTYVGNFFSQAEILDNVPSVFLMLGVATGVCQLTGFALLRHNPSFSSHEQHEPAVSPKGDSLTEDTTSVGRSTYTEDDITARTAHPNNAEENVSNSHHPMKGGTKVIRDFTPWQMLKSWTFFKIAVSYALLVYGLNIVQNYYKQFGTMYIEDDNFLSTVGAVASISIGVSQLMWGGVMDCMGPNLTLLVISAVHTVVAVFWYFTPMVSKWLYLSFTIFDQIVLSGALTTVTVMTLSYFGSTYYVINFGISTTSDAILTLSSPPLVNLILEHFGYFWVFFSVSVGGLISTLMNISLLCRQEDRNG